MFTNYKRHRLDRIYGNSKEVKEQNEKKKSVLVWDLGLGFSHAKRLDDMGHEVYYYLSWEHPYPNLYRYMPGYGFGVIKVRDPFMVIDKVDYVMFTDVGFGATAEYLRRNGKYVYGASAVGDALENDRIKMHEVLDSLGLPAPKYVVVNGTRELKHYLKLFDKEKKFVKVNIFRGDIESFGTSGIKDCQLVIEELEYKLGPFRELQQFIIENELEGVEIGVDAWHNGSEFLPQHFFTFEIKGIGTIGKWMDSSVWTPILNSFSKYLTSFNDQYRYSFSIEGYYHNGKLTCIDVCARPPYPSSAIFSKCIENYDELIFGIAEGKRPVIKYKGSYQCQISVLSSKLEMEKSWLYLCDEKDLNVELRKAVNVDGEIYAAPGDPLACSVIGEGNTVDECFDDAKKILEKLDIRYSEFDEGIFDKFRRKYLEPIEKSGISF